MKVRGLNEPALNQSSPSPSPLNKERRPRTRGVVQSFETNMSSAKIHPTAIVDPNAKIGDGVEIGDDNIIREYCTIHCGSPDGSATKIGDKNFLMSGAHIGHNCLIGNNVVIANNCLLGGYVRVDDGAFLGGGSTFHQFMHIGRLVMVQGSSAFGKDLPPFVVAAERNCVFGLNTVGMRRAGLSANDRNEIKEAFKLIYLSGLNTSQALEKAETVTLGATAREFLDFVASSKKRGICQLKRGEANDVSV